jgi:hypothetical protein
MQFKVCDMHSLLQFEFLDTTGADLACRRGLQSSPERLGDAGETRHTYPKE